MANSPLKIKFPFLAPTKSIKKEASVSTHNGFALTPGVAFGEALLLHPKKPAHIRDGIITGDIEVEVERFTNTISIIKEELLYLQKQVAADIGEAESAIFEFQSQVLEDMELIDSIVKTIRGKKVGMNQAIDHILDQTETNFNKIQSPYFKDKFMDIRDVFTKLKDYIQTPQAKAVLEKAAERILVTDVVHPSIIPPSSEQKIKGLVTKIGGLGSHATILARSYGIPAVGLASEMAEKVEDGDLILIDGHAGTVFINPPQDILTAYQHTIKEFEAYKSKVVKAAHEETKTRDGVKVQIGANCCTEVDIGQATSNGADGIGLFRTEFIFYVHSAFPTEEEQFEIYKGILTRFPGKPTVFRTLDIGGDKFLPYFAIPQQLNPFLGWRSLKISFDMPRVFKSQIRAILRAAHWGQAQILFPMVTSYYDIVKAKEYISSCKEDLAREGLEFDDRIPCGAMIEVPAAVTCFNDIAREVDFVSIGTNDLTQHMLAVDRNNPRVAPFYTFHHPAVVSVIGEIIEKANLLGKPVSLCGEMAANPYYVILLLGLGLRDFSMVPSYIPIVKDIVKSLELNDAREVAKHIRGLKYSKEILGYLKNKTAEFYPDITKVLK
ncbi:phosphoenolpyruvate--protein phosphotransferase [bacterium F11]|nr:phosphoenolpyruvate--protein phosphotransferase [bacterium F11]